MGKMKDMEFKKDRNDLLVLDNCIRRLVKMKLIGFGAYYTVFTWLWSE